ncbi:MAG: hypothetical protein FWE98_08255 [Oscillospiraceae bacterium]|nr:hypothetical protein [Oscillospiraceae bacterium]
MKKLLSLALSGLLLLGLVACDKNAAVLRPVDKPSRMTEYDSHGTMLFSTTYEYDSKGEILRSERRNALGDVRTSEYKNRYNAKGQLVRVKERSNDGRDYACKHTYCAEGQRIETQYKGNSDYSGVIFYTYNAQGQLMQSMDCPNLGHGPTITCEYDEHGLLFREDIFYPHYTSRQHGYYLYEYE